MRVLGGVLFVCLLLLSGCQNKEEEEMNLDNIAFLLGDEEGIEWGSPADFEEVSGQLSPKEK